MELRLAQMDLQISSVFIANLLFAATMDEACIVKTLPDGSAVTEKIKLNSTNVSVSLGPAKIENTVQLIQATSSVPNA